MIKPATKIILILNMVLGIFQFFLSTTRSSGGVKVADLEAQTQMIINQNAQIQDAISEKTNLSIVEEKAKQLGMVQIPSQTLQPAVVAKK